jgi:hypothetical protein
MTGVVQIGLIGPIPFAVLIPLDTSMKKLVQVGLSCGNSKEQKIVVVNPNILSASKSMQKQIQSRLEYQILN